MKTRSDGGGARPNLGYYVYCSLRRLILPAALLAALVTIYFRAPLLPLHAYCMDTWVGGLPVAGELNERFRRAYLKQILFGSTDTSELSRSIPPILIHGDDVRVPADMWVDTFGLTKATAEALRELYRAEHRVDMGYPFFESAFRVPGVDLGDHLGCEAVSAAATTNGAWASGLPKPIPASEWNRTMSRSAPVPDAEFAVPYLVSLLPVFVPLLLLAGLFAYVGERVATWNNRNPRLFMALGASLFLVVPFLAFWVIVMFQMGLIFPNFVLFVALSGLGARWGAQIADRRRRRPDLYMILGAAPGAIAFLLLLWGVDSAFGSMP